MIRTLYRSGKGKFTTDVPINHWRVALRDAHGLFWADFSDETPELAEPLLREIFGFHSLAIDDALREAHGPKVDSWGHYLYVVMHAASFDSRTLELQTSEIDIFLGHNYVVTFRRQAVKAIDRVWQTYQHQANQLAPLGPDHVLYILLDQLTADYMPVVDALDDAIDRVEDEVFARPSQATLNTIFAVKRAVLHLRRLVGPQREVLNRLARDEYAVIDAKDRVYFRDVYDHLVRLADINEGLRDLVSGVLDTYLSVTSNRINEVMKVLTLISALFMPVSFLAGFFGMNFLNLPYDSRSLLYAALGLMALAPAGMFAFFWYRRWL